MIYLYTVKNTRERLSTRLKSSDYDKRDVLIFNNRENAHINTLWKWRWLTLPYKFESLLFFHILFILFILDLLWPDVQHLCCSLKLTPRSLLMSSTQASYAITGNKMHISFGVFKKLFFSSVEPASYCG